MSIFQIKGSADVFEGFNTTIHLGSRTCTQPFTTSRWSLNSKETLEVLLSLSKGETNSAQRRIPGKVKQHHLRHT
jgi:hypothetical protein